METPGFVQPAISVRLDALQRAVAAQHIELGHQARTIDKVRLALIALSVCVGCILAALMLSPLAHADVTTFEQDVTDAGFQGAPVSAYLALGEHICQTLHQGYSKHDIAETIYEHTKFENVGDAMQLVNIADRDLCQSGSSA